MRKRNLKSKGIYVDFEANNKTQEKLKDDVVIKSENEIISFSIFNDASKIVLFGDNDIWIY